MRYLISRTWRWTRMLLLGIGLGLWITSILISSYSTLGGAPIHLEASSGLLMAGLALGNWLRGRLMFSRLPALLGFAIAAIPGFGIIPWLLLPSSLSLPCLAVLGLAAGLVFSPAQRLRQHSTFPYFAGIGLGITIFSFTMHQYGLRPIIFLALVLGLFGLLAPRVPMESMSVSPKSGFAASRPGSWICLVNDLMPVLLAGILASAWPRLTAQVSPPTHSSLLESLIGLAIIGTLASVIGMKLQSRKSPSSLRPALLLLTALTLTTILWAYPRALEWLAQHVSDISESLMILNLSLFLILMTPMILILGLHTSGRHFSLLLILFGLTLPFTGAVLIPHVGSHGALKLVATTCLLMAALEVAAPALLPAGRSFGRLSAAGFILLTGFIPLLAFQWDPAPLAQLEAKRPHVPGIRPKTPELLIVAAEDSQGIFVVTGRQRGNTLYAQGRVVYDAHQAIVERFAGHLAMLLHPKAQTTAVIGTTGTTAMNAMRQYKPLSLEWRTPSRASISAAQAFAHDHQEVLLDPRVEVTLQGIQPKPSQAARYASLVVLGPPPDAPGAAAVYTLEGFLSLRHQLAPDGVLVIALPSPPNGSWLSTLLSTFRQAFPTGLVWLSPGVEPRLILSASVTGRKISLSQLQKQYTLETVREKLTELGLGTPMALLSQLLLRVQSSDRLEAVPRGALDPMPRPNNIREGSTALAILEPALGSLLPAFSDLGTGPDVLATQAALTQIVEKHRAYLNLLTQLGQGVFTNVIQEARKMSALSPTGSADLDGFIQPYLLRATYFEESGQPDKAIEQLSVARLINPQHTGALLQLARIYEAKELPQQAIPLYRDVLRIDPSSTLAAQALANLARARGKPLEAIQILEALSARVPGDARLYHNLGSLYLGQDDWEKARTLFEEAIELDRFLGEPHAGLAEVYFRQGRLDVAQREAEVSVRLMPSTHALNLLGQIAMRRGDSAAARLAFVQCLLKDPDYVEARGGLGILYAAAGKPDKAREAWKTVLAIDPDNQAAKENLKRLESYLLPGLPGR